MDHPLRGVDSAFLYLETPTTHLHVAWAAELDATSRPESASPAALARLVQSRLPNVPALRWRLAYPKVRSTHPVWVDGDVDAAEHIVAHDPAPLAEVAGRIMGEPLDRGRPLWELHVVPELPDGRVGLIMKMHHALLDGPSGAELMAELLDLEPIDPPPPSAAPAAPPASAPKPADEPPTPRRGIGWSPAGAARASQRLADVSAALQRWDLAHPGAAVPAPLSAPRTMFNRAVSAERAVCFAGLPLDDVDAVRRPVGATVNDVVLAICGGALRRYLLAHQALPGPPLQALVPVSLRKGERAAGGNQVSAFVTTLATHVADPQERLAEISRVTDAAKRRHDDTGMSSLLDVADLIPPPTGRRLARLTELARASAWMPVPYNVVVSNVVGPDIALYCNGALVESAYPMGPITDWAALNITVVSYLRHLSFGVVTCPHVVPDLDLLAEALAAEIADVRLAAQAASIGAG